ncbi:hypothetical protein HOE04_00250, partial [archaeon]|nr:hypothetical protein [archaeon]
MKCYVEQKSVQIPYCSTSPESQTFSFPNHKRICTPNPVGECGVDGCGLTYGNCPDKTYCDGDKIKEEKGICSSNTCTYASATILKDCVKERGECVTCEDSEGFGKCVAKPDGIILTIPEKNAGDISVSELFTKSFCCEDGGCSGSTCSTPISESSTDPLDFLTSFGDCNCLDKEDKGILKESYTKYLKAVEDKIKQESCKYDSCESDTACPYGCDFVEYFCESGKMKKELVTRCNQEPYEAPSPPEESIYPILIQDVNEIFDKTNPTNHIRYLEQKHIAKEKFDSTENLQGIEEFYLYLMRTDLTNDLIVKAHLDLGRLLEAQAMSPDFSPKIHSAGREPIISILYPTIISHRLHKISFKIELDEMFREKVTGWSPDGTDWFSFDTKTIPNDENSYNFKGYRVDPVQFDALFDELIETDNLAITLKKYRDGIGVTALLDYSGDFIHEDSEYPKKIKFLRDAIKSFEAVELNALQNSDIELYREASYSSASAYMKLLRPELTEYEKETISKHVRLLYKRFISGYSDEVTSDAYHRLAAFEYHRSFFYPKDNRNIASSLEFIKKAIDRNSDNIEAKDFQKNMTTMILTNIRHGFGIMLMEGEESLNANLNVFNVVCWNRNLNTLLDEFETASNKAEEVKGALVLLDSLQNHQKVDIRKFALEAKIGERYKMIGKLKRFQPVISDAELRTWLEGEQNRGEPYNGIPIIAANIMSDTGSSQIREELRMKMTLEEVGTKKRPKQYQDNLESIKQYDILVKKAFCLPDIALMFTDGDADRAWQFKRDKGCFDEADDPNQNKYYFLFKTGETYEYQTVTNTWSDTFINFLTPVDIALMATPMIAASIYGKTLKFAKLIKLAKSADKVTDALRAAKITTLGAELDTAIETALRTGVSRTFTQEIGQFTATTFVQGMSEEIAFQLVGNAISLVPGLRDIGQIITLVGAPGFPDIKPKQKWIFFDANQKTMAGLELRNADEVTKYLDGMETKGFVRDGNKLTIEGNDYLVYNEKNALDVFSDPNLNIKHATKTSTLKDTISRVINTQHFTADEMMRVNTYWPTKFAIADRAQINLAGQRVKESYLTGSTNDKLYQIRARKLIAELTEQKFKLCDGTTIIKSNPSGEITGTLSFFNSPLSDSVEEILSVNSIEGGRFGAITGTTERTDFLALILKTAEKGTKEGAEKLDHLTVITKRRDARGYKSLLNKKAKPDKGIPKQTLAKSIQEVISEKYEPIEAAKKLKEFKDLNGYKTTEDIKTMIANNHAHARKWIEEGLDITDPVHEGKFWKVLEPREIYEELDPLDPTDLVAIEERKRISNEVGDMPVLLEAEITLIEVSNKLRGYLYREIIKGQNL